MRDEVTTDEGKPIDEGVEDKRLLVSESEFAKALIVMQRDGNTLSPVVRDAWDATKPLQTLVKASPLMATDPHISIVGDITQEELDLVLSHADTFNGFANRFLWVYVARNGVKPEGRDVDLAAEIAYFKSAVQEAQKRGRMYRDHNARRMWHRVYPFLSAGHTGRFGAATSRAEAQTVRLSLLFALIDRSEYIRPEHLSAALTLWRYCEESARIIFGELTPFQMRLVEILKEGPKTASQIREVLHRNKTMLQILPELAALMQRGIVVFEKDNSGVEKYRLAPEKKGR